MILQKIHWIRDKNENVKYRLANTKLFRVLSKTDAKKRFSFFKSFIHEFSDKKYQLFLQLNLYPTKIIMTEIMKRCLGSAIN